MNTVIRQPLAAGMTICALLAAGCGGAVSNSSKVALQQLQQVQAAGSEDVNASVQALSLYHGLAALADEAAVAAGIGQWVRPAVKASAAPPPQALPAGTPPVAGVTSSVALGPDGSTTRLTYAVSLGSAGADTIALDFQGAVSKPADTAGALQQLQDRSSFPIVSLKHALDLADPQGTRHAGMDCIGTAPQTCTSVLSGGGVQLALKSQRDLATGKESGNGTVALQGNTRARRFFFVRGGDGSGSETLIDPVGVTATLVVAADGSLSGSVVTATSSQAIQAAGPGTLVGPGGNTARLF